MWIVKEEFEGGVKKKKACRRVRFLYVLCPKGKVDRLWRKVSS
jgi:hypothetical protein